ncbi:C-terminal binding protein [Calycomorphotria hydatis]|uniref:D-3-phosphoglycerate dehydrogenase n=1 Tax=Calycomorphotria hydatis TaxID=2528027 RepID=A0A517TA36_9PLAN|nr:C-terminal binding protein [Calycomorphotria hydatis]QDT65237.1 D-3-phosphoglycerate dehydrogenase [Calycomorphotria hydatis]
MAQSASVLMTDHSFDDLSIEESLLCTAGVDLLKAQCKSADEVLACDFDPDALIVQWARIDERVFQKFPNCKAVIRLGVGVDNIDCDAARDYGVAVCNVPDYGMDEVADHAVAMAVALGRQLPQLDVRTRNGEWSLSPVSRMPAFREMLFAVAGLGRIGQAVIERARGFKFQLAAYDPMVPGDVFDRIGVQRLNKDELFEKADILSLHLPLCADTEYLVDAHRLNQMKSSAILINTARGGLVDLDALASSLQRGAIAYAGLDVFEVEPPDFSHPIFQCQKAILTSHIAWHSDASMPRLRQLAVEETLRAIRGEPLRNVANQIEQQHSDHQSRILLNK